MTTRNQILRQLEAQTERVGGRATVRWLRALRAADAKVTAQTDRRSQRAVARLAKHASSWADGVFSAGAL
jgi:hypothetical protein